MDEHALVMSGTSRAGFALVVVLGALAIMTLLLLALLRGASHQVRGAEGDAAYAREKMLADSAVALVIGQIQEASTQPGLAWISQPGLVRTYDATASRLPTKSYKLYSAAPMADPSGTLAFLAADIPADWNSTANQNLYTDLNAPQRTPGLLGDLIYPILDPAANGNIAGVKIDPGHAAEMPVMWLYELQDGTLGPAGNATRTNPIVGRIAFWTDDETCKININTAGAGGVLTSTGVSSTAVIRDGAWNTPRANSTDDVAWSTTQPSAGEFSRYPGHPAMTSLLPVFGLGSPSLTRQQLLGLSSRYGWGGSEFGAKNTTFGEIVAPKTDRVYGSLDELCFGAAADSNGQRQANPVTPAQLNQARFVLTAHSNAPETTLLGEPRFAIWPVADAAQDATRTTATDRAIASAATIGTRKYFFQRHNALSATDDLDASTAWGQSNTQLFNDLITRGGETLPGYGAAFTQKYDGAKWPQLMIEILDFMRGLNAVDPSPAPFVSYAAGASTGLGRAFIIPLTADFSGTSLRGLGRCPTLSSLTLVLYVCGFGFDDQPPIDFEATPDDTAGTTWQATFLLPSLRWKHVTSELVRAFVVPCTFQPGCAFPEVSDDCDIQITGLDGIQVSLQGGKPGSFWTASAANSPLLGMPRKVIFDRAWGGNEGPVAWRATGDALASKATASYPFAGTQSFTVPFSSYPTYYPASPQNPPELSWPPMPELTLNAASLTVLIRDAMGHPIQTCAVDFPSVTLPAPTIDDEADHLDGSTPSTSSATWSTDAANHVWPSYYMSLNHRLLATQRSRPLMIQPGDISRGVEAGTDLRLIASLANVPATFLPPHPVYTISADPDAHNLRFADGTSAYGTVHGTLLPDGSFAWSDLGYNRLVKGAPYAANMVTTTGTDWNYGTSVPVPGGWLTSAPCSAPTTASASSYVAMTPGSTLFGDWDTGPGFGPDGALINLPDAGTSADPAAAYFSLAGAPAGPPAATRFAPNALVSSPVIFGSLPAGPNPAAGMAHPGYATPPDHLVLDNFWMPVVEPYALSTCMATAGKINLNDQIAPFTYLHRNTALHAVLGDLRIPAIPLNMANPYKTTGPAIASIWEPVDENATLLALEKRFATGDAYLSESEICTVPLVPQGQTVDSLNGFWYGPPGDGQLTGDNLRELPYAQLYGRLTTRSNSYTVHVRVQVLQKLAGDPQQNVWKEGTDLVLGDWRGSYEIERYLDPAAKAPAAGQPLGPYRFRIVSARRFAP